MGYVALYNILRTHSKSQRRDLNPRPLDYESSALPLSHVGILDDKYSSRGYQVGP